jgi:Type I phosphodiesterase / nucleotide pyrophosphatase
MLLTSAALSFAAMLAVAAPAAPLHQGAGGPPSPAPTPPRLIVFIAVDQLIPEQLERLRPHLSGGLGRFVSQGTWYRDAWIDYAITVTAPGHATLSTGVFPCRHGVVANEEPKRDESGLQATVAEPGALRVPGLVDWMRLRAPGSRSFSASVKDRAAILLAGQAPEVAVCWDSSAGGFEPALPGVKDLPKWIADWNAGWIERATPAGKPWVWEPVLPADPDTLGCQPDDQPGESPSLLGGIEFPHTGPSAPAAGERSRKLAAFVIATPLGDAFCIALARRAVEELDLGADAVPDVLCVSLSGCDTVGHALGPYSREVTDLLLRADRELARLFDDLDARAGKGGWIAALSSDHGVPDLVERRLAGGQEARRIPNATLSDARRAVEAALVERGLGEALLAFDGHALFLKPSHLRDSKTDPVELRRQLRQLLVERLPCARAYTREEMAGACAFGHEHAARVASSNDPLQDPWLALAARSYDAERSPDVAIQYPPGHLILRPTGTTHGSTYDYDRRVPLVFLGPGFPAHEDWRRVRTVDALPTLLEAAGLPVPDGLDGRALLGSAER